MGATLANLGVNPLTHSRVADSRYVPKVLAIMMMAGFYNESGMWAYTAGLPAKTGVGGGIVAVVPGKMAIVGFSPWVNEAGNSVRSRQAIEYISDQLGANVFGNGLLMANRGGGCGRHHRRESPISGRDEDR